MMYYVVDGGRTVEGAAARRHPDFKGQLVFKALTQSSLIDTLTERPGIQKIRGVSPHLEFYEKDVNMQHVRIIDRKVLRLII